MAEDLIELGLEGFDLLTDKYYDVVHDTACKVGPWIKDQRSRGRKDSKGAKGQSMPTSPVGDRPSRDDRYDNRDLDDGRRRKSDGRDYDDRKDSGRRRNIDRDDKYDYRGGGRSRAGSTREREQYSRSPQVRADDAPSHIYPPGPGAMAPPYPTTAGALVAMPPDANYPPVSRSRSTRGLDVPHNSRHERTRSAGHSDDYYDDRRRRSSRHSENGARSRSRVRQHSSYRKEETKERDMHLGAGLIGAVAGGYAARMAGKGDWKVTAAGAVVGALGGGLLEKGFEKHKKRDSREEDAWEQKWGRR